MGTGWCGLLHASLIVNGSQISQFVTDNFASIVHAGTSDFMDFIYIRNI